MNDNQLGCNECGSPFAESHFADCKVATGMKPEPVGPQPHPTSPVTLHKAAAILAMAQALAPKLGVDLHTAIRRTMGTSDWKHDPERMAAAQAKRERKNARNRKGLGDRNA